jgi:hypothetical protein
VVGDLWPVARKITDHKPLVTSQIRRKLMKAEILNLTKRIEQSLAQLRRYL